MPMFSAWKLGLYYVIPAFLIGLLGLVGVYYGYKSAWGLVILCFSFALFSLYFFRDPVRTITAAPNEIVSPADGTVVAIETLEHSPYYEGPCKRVSIFLSVLNVHVNRAPFEGTIKSIQYRPGQFVNAMRADSSDCNEANTVQMDSTHGLITVRQIAGLIARRIVCIAKPGDTVAKGQKFGMIQFGSRTELYLPIQTDVLTHVHDKVSGGISILARFP